MIFYAVPVSNFCAKVEIVLALKNLSADVRLPPSGYGSTEYKSIVPAGTVPALVDGNLVLSESDSIIEYLEEKYPHPKLLPQTIEDRAKVRMLARLHDLKVEPLIRSLFKHMAPTQRDIEFIEATKTSLSQQLHLLIQLGNFNPFIAGEDITLADCGYAPSLLLAQKMFHESNVNFSLPDRFCIWQEKLNQHDKTGPVLKQYGHAVDNWITQKRTQ
ncbi:glutathione S-transferase family protein [Kiloniella sp. EL199]|uniref:glutathione S-transferase family protein n=1 Tax=Kiloniella sp. EL199 TaxID=2107581 RepID=UPI0013C49438|nr:glutathione S-transferase family protein [Kiloniella sp. EL199]